MRGACRVVVWLLTACLVLVAGVVYSQTVPHAVHHAHHNAAAHASVLCAWLCAAGQGIQGPAVVIPETLGLLSTKLTPATNPFRTAPAALTPSRGPPHLA